jgi:hypothetical protein
LLNLQLVKQLPVVRLAVLVAALVVQAQALVQVLAQALVLVRPAQVPLQVALVWPVQWVLPLLWVPLLPFLMTTTTPQCLFLSPTKLQHMKTPPDGGVFFCLFL